MAKSMLERYNEWNGKEKQANEQEVDFQSNDVADGFKANRQQGDKTEFKDAAIQSRTADTSVKYTDITRN